eukprot:3346524-Amphidinium_carterae.1
MNSNVRSLPRGCRVTECIVTPVEAKVSNCLWTTWITSQHSEDADSSGTLAVGPNLRTNPTT